MSRARHHGPLHGGTRRPHHRGRYASVSAFSPICSPMNCPWGEKALSGYLGNNKEIWRRYDACALLEDGARLTELLVDQGAADQFLATQLKPQLLETACARARVPLNAAHTRRLRSLLLLHFYVYRKPSPLARAAVRHRNRSINGTFDRVCHFSLGTPKRHRAMRLLERRYRSSGRSQAGSSAQSTT